MRADQFDDVYAFIGPGESDKRENKAIARYKRMYRHRASVLGGAIREPHAPSAAWWVALPKAVRPIAGAVRRAITGRSQRNGAFRPVPAAETLTAPVPLSTTALPSSGAATHFGVVALSGRPATPARGRPQRSDPPQFMLRLLLAGLAACISHGARVVRPLWIVPRAAASAVAPALRARARVAALVALVAPERALVRSAVGVLCRIGFVAASGFALGAAIYVISGRA